MKINMWKLLLAGLFASAALAGCEDNRNNFMVDDTISFVNEEQYAGVSVYNGKYELAILKNGKGQQSAKALLSVSETALAEYNTANGTNYAVLPANCYKLSSSTVGFSDGDTRKFVEVTWDDAAIFALGEDTEYAIPLELTVVDDALVVDENRNVKIINPKRASIGMEKELATPFYPTATHEVITFDGNIVLDNAIATMDLTVDYKIDNSLVDAYNQAKGTNYLAAPEGFATLDATSSQIAAGETTAKFSGKINSDKLFTGNNLDIVGDLLVPVRITSTSLDGITVTTEVMYVPLTSLSIVKGTRKSRARGLSWKATASVMPTTRCPLHGAWPSTRPNGCSTARSPMSGFLSGIPPIRSRWYSSQTWDSDRYLPNSVSATATTTRGMR